MQNICRPGWLANEIMVNFQEDCTPACFLLQTSCLSLLVCFKNNLLKSALITNFKGNLQEQEGELTNRSCVLKGWEATKLHNKCCFTWASSSIFSIISFCHQLQARDYRLNKEYKTKILSISVLVWNMKHLSKWVVHSKHLHLDMKGVNVFLEDWYYSFDHNYYNFPKCYCA